MDLNESENLILKITEYALNRKRFTLNELVEDLSLDKEDTSFVANSLLAHNTDTNNPNHLLTISKQEIVNQSTVYYYSLVPTAFYNYVDYLEIKEARKHADEAKKQSMLALQITVYSILIAVILGLAQLLFSVIELLFKR
jgi:hypothetical protein